MFKFKGKHISLYEYTDPKIGLNIIKKTIFFDKNTINAIIPIINNGLTKVIMMNVLFLTFARNSRLMINLSLSIPMYFD